MGVRVTNHVSCVFGQIKYKYWDIKLTQKEIQIQKEIYKQISINTSLTCGADI